MPLTSYSPLLGQQAACQGLKRCVKQGAATFIQHTFLGKEVGSGVGTRFALLWFLGQTP